jgi:hypothetical protein
VILRALKLELRQALSRAQQHKKQIFLEIFSGHGVISAKLRASGFGVVSVDIQRGAHFDVLRRCVSSTLLGWIKAGIVLGIWLGTPCTTWSLAKTRPRVRSIDRIWGFDNLSLKDALAVRVGNATARFSAQVIRVARATSTPVALENPNGSRLWHAPPIAALVPLGVVTTSDMCQFGARWVKRTRVCFWNCGDSSKLCKHCCGSHGLCSRTKKAHIILRGTPADSNVLWTKIAEAYPAAWASVAASVLMDSCTNNVTSRLYRLAQIL